MWTIFLFLSTETWVSALSLLGDFCIILAARKKNPLFFRLDPNFPFLKVVSLPFIPRILLWKWKVPAASIHTPFLYSFNFRDFWGSVGADVAPFLLLPTYPLLCLPWPQNSGCKNAHPGFPREIKILLNPASSSSSGETKAYPPCYLLVVWTEREKEE